MSPSTIIIIMILAAIAAISIFSYIKKLRSGCCGSSDTVKKVRPSDGNAKNYPYRKTAVVDGMVCQNCARRIENAFNAQEGIMAKVNSQNKTAEIYGKSPLEDAHIRSTITKSGYTLMSIK